MLNIFTIEPNVPVGEDTQWNVIVTTTESWKEVRRLKSSKPKSTYTLNFKGRTASVGQSIVDFYNQQSGDAVSFYWKNPLENPIMAEVLGSGDGSSKTFYFDHYPLSSGDYTVYKAGIAQAETTDYAVNGTAGSVTFVSAPAVGAQIKSDYQFYRIVRFVEKPTRELVDYGVVNATCKFLEVL